MRPRRIATCASERHARAAASVVNVFRIGLLSAALQTWACHLGWQLHSAPRRVAQAVRWRA
jgi:hypothetical protein